MDRPWLAHYDPSVPYRIEYPNFTLPQLFGSIAGRYPQRVATILYGARLTYRQLAGRIDAFGAGLTALGVRSGDRVAVMLPNIPQFIVAFYGTLQAGAIAVPTNPMYTTHELEHQLADSGATAVVTLDALCRRVCDALPATSVRALIGVDLATALPRRLGTLYTLKERRAGRRRMRGGGIVHRFEDLVRTPPLTRPGTARPDDVAVLQYTGGTTGVSKGAMLTHRNLVSNALQVHAWQAADPEDEMVLCAAPFFHVYGLTVGMNLAIAAGAAMLLLPRFIPADVAKAAQHFRPQMFPGVPTMYTALANLPGFSQTQFGSLQVCISGAAPLPPEVQRRFEEVCGARLVEGYGLTEAAPVTHCNPVWGDRRPGTVGVPFPDTDASITDPVTWEPLPPGAVGEMTVRGPQVMAGYWQRPAETAAVLRDGWLHTGDLATMDEDGYFRIVDRKKDMIISSGFNVYPREVEDVLYSHPAILEAAVIGVRDAYRGETVKAVVVLKPGRTATPEEIEAYCRTQLAPFKVPRIVEFRDSLPKSLVGKVLRRTLQEEETAMEPVESGGKGA